MTTCEIKTKMIRDSGLRLSRAVTQSKMSPLEREPGPGPVPRAPGDGYLGARRGEERPGVSVIRATYSLRYDPWPDGVVIV